MKTIKVKFLKSHPEFAYNKGDIAVLTNEHAAALHKSGHVMLLPDDEDDEKINPLPEDLPGRDILFRAGFDTVEKIAEAGDSLVDAGISNTMLKKVKAYLK